MTLAVQPRRRNVFDNVKVRANRQQHRYSYEARRRRITRNRDVGVILQNLPQAPQRARINQMKIRVRVRLHEPLVIGEEIKVRLALPLLEAFVELSRIPRRQRNVLEQGIREEIEFVLAHHLQVIIITQSRKQIN